MRKHFLKKLRKAELYDFIFATVGMLVTLLGLGVFVVLVVDVFMDGAGRLTWQFLTSFPSRIPQSAGILSALAGTIWLMAVTGAIAIPLGIMAGIYLEEYGKKNWLSGFIEINIANLAGIPSIIYGILGLALFVRFFDLGRSVIAGGATLALLVLPIIILATREALRAVPSSLREASFALGATKWQTLRYQVLPAASPGILTGIILAMSRAIGESAPLIMIGALAFIAFLPQGLSDPFTALPIQIFNWVSRPQHDFAVNAAAGIIVLLVITLMMNGLAIWLRYRFEKKVRW
jgi:phosphate transport system permease protein